MNKFKFYFILLITTVSIFSCSKSSDDDSIVEPLRDYQTQYNTEIAIIEKYLNSNYINLSDPNYADKDPVIEKITDPATQPSLMSYLNASSYPKLLYKIVAQNNIEYKLYYLVLREGTKDDSTGLGGISPCSVDGVFTAYKGTYLQETAATATVPSDINAVTFEEAKYPNSTLSLLQTITGWGEVFPEFKTGSYTKKADGTISYNNFGAGMMFLPSGLAYYNLGSASIPTYVPLVFSFKLYDIQRLDQDGDGIPSYLEDLNKDGYVRTSITVNNPDDTDKDGIPDFLDVDDDGDKYTTSTEINNYAFDLIPSCSGDNTDPKRIKKYLDSSCH